MVENFEYDPLTDSVIILSNSIAGAMWKSNTKYCKTKKKKHFTYLMHGNASYIHGNLLKGCFFSSMISKIIFAEISRDEITAMWFAWNMINGCLCDGAIENVRKTNTHFVIIRAIRWFLHRRVLLLIADLDAHNGIHVEAGQLACLDDGHTHLKILRLQMLLESCYRSHSIACNVKFDKCNALQNRFKTSTLIRNDCAHIVLPFAFAFDRKFFFVFAIARIVWRCLWNVIASIVLRILCRGESTDVHIANQWPIFNGN